MRFLKQVICILIFLPGLYAQTIERITVHVRNNEEIINKVNLDRIKYFILKKGLKTTYSQMYNDNPSYPTGHHDFYLNPDSGQRNINCDPKKSDFNILAIRIHTLNDHSDDECNGQYVNLNFMSKLEIKIDMYNVNPAMQVSKILESTRLALREILEIIANTGEL
jgi:hypothetical protein